MGPIYSLDDIIDMLRRRAVLILCVIGLGSALSLAYALSQTHMYRSSEVVQVTQPKIADDLARSTVEGSAARRLQLIEQRLMTRGSLQEIIDEYGLYADMPALKPSERVNLLRRSVRIDGVAAVGDGAADDGAVSILTITADMPTPLQAQQIAHEFAQRTIRLSTQTRLEQARETLAFFTAREDALASRVAQLEDQLAAFRNANDLTLPGSLDFRRSEIATINESLLDIARERIRIERAADQAARTERKATADRLLADSREQLATLDAQRQLLTDRKTELEKFIETTPEIERRLGAFDRELEQLHGEFEVASARRTEAEVGYRLETQSQSERLTVIEPAVAPDYPFTGSRKRMALAGGVISVVVALALAVLLEFRNPVLRTAAHMERELGVKPVVSVPYLDTSRRRGSLLGRLRARFGLRRMDDTAPDSTA